jgi:hypothetical protein
MIKLKTITKRSRKGNGVNRLIDNSPGGIGGGIHMKREHKKAIQEEGFLCLTI